MTHPKFINVIKYGFVAFILLYSSLSFINCGPPIYGIANQGGESIYLQKPVIRDSDHEFGYYGTGSFYSSYKSGAYHDTDECQFAQFGAYRSDTWRHFNTSFGANGYSGQYFVHHIPAYRGFYSFAGFGFNTEANVNVPIGILDWRIIGFRFSGVFENGEYSTFFRRPAAVAGLIEDVNPGNWILNYSFTDDLILKFDKFDIGLYTLLGFSSSDNGRGNVNLTSCLHFTSGKFTGFIQSNAGYYSTFNLGLAYRFYK